MFDMFVEITQLKPLLIPHNISHVLRISNNMSSSPTNTSNKPLKTTITDSKQPLIKINNNTSTDHIKSKSIPTIRKPSSSSLNAYAPAYLSMTPTRLESIDEHTVLSIGSETIEDNNQYGLVDYDECNKCSYDDYQSLDSEDITPFQVIDKLFAKYYQTHNRKYYFNDFQIGRFMGYVIYEQLCDIIDIPLGDSLSDNCRYRDCVYHGFDDNFPMNKVCFLFVAAIAS